VLAIFETSSPRHSSSSSCAYEVRPGSWRACHLVIGDSVLHSHLPPPLRDSTAAAPRDGPHHPSPGIVIRDAIVQLSTASPRLQRLFRRQRPSTTTWTDAIFALRSLLSDSRIFAQSPTSVRVICSAATPSLRNSVFPRMSSVRSSAPSPSRADRLHSICTALLPSHPDPATNTNTHPPGGDGGHLVRVCQASDD